jgi:hypothetical protein
MNQAGMKNSKSVLCNEKSPVNVGVARHSIVGATVYGAKLRKHIMKVKYQQENNAMVGCKQRPNKTTVDGNSLTGTCFSSF